MKISEALARDGRILSFEFFPPKTPTGEDKLLQRLQRLKSYSPTFVSVTQHAGLNTLEKTKRIVKIIHHRHVSLVMNNFHDALGLFHGVEPRMLGH